MPQYACRVVLWLPDRIRCLSRIGTVVKADGPDEAHSVARQEVSDKYDWPWEQVEVETAELVG